MKKFTRFIVCCLMLSILLSVSVSAGQAAGQDDTYTVPNPGIPSDAAVFQGHYYYYFEDDASWDKAKYICYIFGGHLVSINSKEEQQFLESQYPDTAGWIGAFLNGEVWEWANGDEFHYTHWKSGEPNNQNNSEGYAHLYTDMEWNDLPINDTTFHHGFYCEWDSDTRSYYRNGLFDNDISEEVQRLLSQGKNYLYGLNNTEFDIGAAWECFSAATDDYSSEAWYYIGEMLAHNLTDTYDSDLRAYGAYERAIVYGCPLGWLGLGNLFLLGQYVEQDFEKALTCYQTATSLGAIEGYYGIGMLFQSGLGVEQDEQKALACFERAERDSNNMYIIDAVADCYFFGVGTSVDYEKALQYYHCAAANGSGYAQYSIGWMYETGTGVQKDIPTALQWYNKCINNPHLTTEIKESVGEEITSLVSELAAAQYESSTQPYIPEIDYPQNISDFDYPQGLNGEYDYQQGIYDFDIPQGLNDFDFPQGLNGEYGFYYDEYDEPFTLDIDFQQ